MRAREVERPAGALDGLKVLDLTRLLPGPFCTLMLGDQGADVTKVEDTGPGDYIRWMPPFYGAAAGAADGTRSAMYLALNRNKRSIALDLKTDAGRRAMLRMAREHDVFVESFRPGVMNRLGLGYEALKAENKRIVYCSISGYGQTGPSVDRAGHDLNFLALSGLLGLTGQKQGPPIQSATQIADLGGGAMAATFGILAALYERRLSGEGQFVDTSMFDGVLSWMGVAAAGWFCDGREPKRGELLLSGGVICYAVYETLDGKWVALAALEAKFWRAWCEGVGRPDLIDSQFERPGSRAEARVKSVFKERTRDAWAEFADSCDCCLDPVLGLAESLESDRVKARGMIVEVDQPDLGSTKQLGSPIKLSRTPGSIRRPAPGQGEHTDQILSDIGYSEEEIAELRSSGVVR